MTKNFVLVNLLLLIAGLAASISAQNGTPNLVRAEQFRQQNDWGNAIIFYTKSIESNETNGDVFLTAVSYGHRAQAYYYMNDLDRAIADCNKAISFKSDIGWVYHLRGNSQSRKGNLDEAIADLTFAIQLEPKKPESYSVRGNAYSKKKNYDLAIADYTKAIELGNKDDYILRGTAFRNQGKLDESIADFNTAIKFDPRDVDAYIGRGLGYRYKQIYDQAIDSYTKAIELDPESFNAFLFRGNANVANGDYDKAMSDYANVLRIQPDNQSVYGVRGDALVKKLEFQKAMIDYDKRLSFAPKELGTIYSRAWAHLYMNNGAGAYADSTRFLELSNERVVFIGYAQLVGYFGLRKAGKLQEAKNFLATPPKFKENNEWVKSLIDFAKGDLSVDQLLKLATDNDKRTEAHAYIGEMQLLDGDQSGARSHFDWVKSNGNKSFSEYLLVMSELSRLKPQT